MIKIVGKGRSAQLRHLRRTQRVNIDWLYEVFHDLAIRLRYVPSKLQLADVLTKGSFTRPLWNDILKIINIGAHAKTIPSSTTTPPRVETPLIVNNPIPNSMNKDDVISDVNVMSKKGSKGNALEVRIRVVHRVL